MYAQNVYFHDNVVRCGSGSITVAAAVQDVGSTAVFTSRNNRYENNDYDDAALCANPSAVGRFFAWMNGYRNWPEWGSYGHDDTGSYTP